MKRVLFIAYAFPPSGGAGVQRTAKFVRYLPEFGWLPTVITVAPTCYAIQDRSFEEFPKNVDVIRTPHVDPVARFARPRSTNGNGSGSNGSHARLGVSGNLRKLARNGWIALDRNLLVPDPAVLWCPVAINAGLDQLFSRRFDLVYATGEPYSSYFTAMTLSRLSGVSFVIDMRDPWTLAPYRREVRSEARIRLEKRQERRVLSECSAAIFANRASDLYAEAFPQWANKFHYIPNGYDSADFQGIEPKRFDKLTMVHTGTFLPGYRTADTFLTALRQLIDAKPELRRGLQVILVGKIGDEQSAIARLSLGDTVLQTGYLAHKESIAHLKGADLLLLIGGEERWEETGKIYEYMATGKPILAVVNPAGSAAEILRSYKAAAIVDRNNVVEVHAALGHLIAGDQHAPAGDTDWASRFERRALTATLADTLEQCVRVSNEPRTELSGSRAEVHPS